MTSGKSEYGIIILGNAGAGISFLCNLIIGSERFKADFQPDAVTSETEYHRMETPNCDYLVYNIPGLVETNQEHIDRNKQEIQKAFNSCPNAIVIFVWTHVGGRVQNDDVLAFEALNNAYAFPREALMFVVNNVPTTRSDKYEGLFITTLVNALNAKWIREIDTIFIDCLDMTNRQQTIAARTKLMKQIVIHPAFVQQQKNPIRLQLDELNDMRSQLKQQQKAAENDRVRFQQQIEDMTKRFNRKQAEANERYEDMKKQMENSKNSYQNPFKALLGFVDSVVDFGVGTVQGAAAGYGAMAAQILHGMSRDEVRGAVHSLLKGTAFERVYGFN